MFKFLKASFNKFKKALSKTRTLLSGKLKTLFKNPLDEATFEKLEQILFEADLGSTCTQDFVSHVRAFVRKNPNATSKEIMKAMRERALEIFTEPPRHTPSIQTARPHVILVVGVNGGGKTTSIAKLAHRLKGEGEKVLLAAADTFRAAAVEQLTHWAEVTETEIVKGRTGSDPAAVVFDALTAAKARNVDTVIIDTAGRLQNKTDLMKELEKIKKTCTKLVKNAPHETLLVLDASTGQNGIDQAVTFNEFTPLTGIILSKLDGSAKGGTAVALYHTLKVPIAWVGLGEQMEDFEPFEAKSFVEALIAED